MSEVWMQTASDPKRTEDNNVQLDNTSPVEVQSDTFLPEQFLQTNLDNAVRLLFQQQLQTNLDNAVRLLFQHALCPDQNCG